MLTQKEDIFTKEVNRFPKVIFDKSIRSGNEFGWRQIDFLEVIETARQKFIAIIGGQIQYTFEEGTCELYWLSYNPSERQKDEDWLSYCNRTAKECIDKFNKLITGTDIEKEALSNFDFLKTKKENGIDINNSMVFILYFDDTETDVFNKKLV